MSRHPVPAFLGLVLVALLGGLVTEDPAAGSPKKSPAILVPDPSDPEAPPLDGDTWTIDALTYTVRLAQLDEAARQEFLRNRTGFNIDPFASRPDRPAAFLTFRLELENRGESSLIFHPQNCWLVTRNMRVEYPLDLATMRSSYGLLEQEMPPAYEAVGKALFDGQLILGPGEKASGLLVYRSVSQRTKRFTVEVQLTLASGDVSSFRAPYRRLKK